jgi:methionyl-tRNA synthetase
MTAVLATLYVAIRDLAIAIAPVIPDAAERLLDTMGIPRSERDYAALEDEGSHRRLAGSGFLLTAPAPIFPRLEAAAEA